MQTPCSLQGEVGRIWGGGLILFGPLQHFSLFMLLEKISSLAVKPLLQEAAMAVFMQWTLLVQIRGVI